MNSYRQSSSQDNVSNLYEFQALDKFIRVVRGRISASSRKHARSAVWKQGLLCLMVWQYGTEHWLARGRFGLPPGGLYHVPTLRLKRKYDELVIYACSSVMKYVLGCLFGVIGLLLLSWHYLSEAATSSANSTFDNVSSVFVFIMGIVFLAVGMFLMSMRFEIIAERSSRRVTMKMSIIPGFWWSEVVNGNSIKEVLFRKEVYYVAWGERCYVVYLLTDRKQVMLDYSGSERKEKEFAQIIAECLEVPLVCEDPAL